MLGVLLILILGVLVGEMDILGVLDGVALIDLLIVILGVELIDLLIVILGVTDIVVVILGVTEGDGVTDTDGCTAVAFIPQPVGSPEVVNPGGIVKTNV
jgi:hypothetical protein